MPACTDFIAVYRPRTNYSRRVPVRKRDGFEILSGSGSCQHVHVVLISTAAGLRPFDLSCRRVCIVFNSSSIAAVSGSGVPSKRVPIFHLKAPIHCCLGIQHGVLRDRISDSASFFWNQPMSGNLALEFDLPQRDLAASGQGSDRNCSCFQETWTGIHLPLRAISLAPECDPAYSMFGNDFLTNSITADICVSGKSNQTRPAAYP